jgi:hypothetical protein
MVDAVVYAIGDVAKGYRPKTPANPQVPGVAETCSLRVSSGR